MNPQLKKTILVSLFGGVSVVLFGPVAGLTGMFTLALFDWFLPPKYSISWGLVLFAAICCDSFGILLGGLAYVSAMILLSLEKVIRFSHISINEKDRYGKQEDPGLVSDQD